MSITTVSQVLNNELFPLIPVSPAVKQKENDLKDIVEESNQKNKQPFLHKKEQIENLQSINGLSIEKIEERARPGTYSVTGFIGKNESFKDVLRKDWETVEKLQVTHGEIADHLTNIISLAEKIAKNASRGFFESICIEYNTKDMPNNSIVSEKPQNLEIMLLTTRGVQEDLFDPSNSLLENILGFENSGQKEVNTPKAWNEENIIKNPANGITLHLNSGILSYIREFGFYEGGGDENRYRVDPLKVMALLTGKSLEELKQNIC